MPDFISDLGSLNLDAIDARSRDVTTDWYWEGNVVKTIARDLVGKGWTIVRMPDTRLKEHGIDIEAEKTA